MPLPASARPTLSVWVRVAAFFGFLAVLSALAAPVSVLAQELRSGQLSGICSQNSPSSVSFTGADGLDGMLHADTHCKLCAAPGGGWLPLAVAPGPWLPGQLQPIAHFPVVAGAAVAGLPFSRGPPAL